MTKHCSLHYVLGLALLLLVDCKSVDPPYDDGKTWSAAERVENTSTNFPFQPQVAIDGAGNAIAVWSYDEKADGTGHDVWSNRYTPGEGWGDEELIERDEAGAALRPQVAITSNGDAVAVWQQNGDATAVEEADKARFDIWSNRYTAGVGWGKETRIETDNQGAAMVPQVAMDPNGNTVAVWQQFDGMRFNIWSNRYAADQDWVGAELIENHDGGDAVAPQVATDPDGAAIAVWQQFDGTRFNIWSRRYTPSGGWGNVQPVDPDNSGEAEAPQIAIDAQGNGFAVWQQFDGERFDIWSSRYTPSNNRWSSAERIERAAAGDSAQPQVAVSPNGTAVAIWVRLEGTGLDVWSNRLEPDRGWGTAERVDDRDEGDARSPQIAINAQQNAVAVWLQPHDGLDSVFSNRCSPDGWWGAHRPIEEYEGLTQQPQVAVDPEGNALAIWVQFGGVWSNRLESDPSLTLENGE